MYEKAAVRIVAGETIYRPDDPPAFTYPPFFALPAVPFLLLPDFLRPFAWTLVNLILLALIVGQVRYLATPWIQIHGNSRRWLIRSGWVMVAILAARFLISPLEYRSHDYFVLLAVILVARSLADGRGLRAGVWAGLATACKATPLLVLPVLLWQRHFRGSLAFVLTLAAATLLPDLIVPSSDGQPWAATWYRTFVAKVGVGEAPDVQGAWKSWNSMNQSLSGTLYRLATTVTPGKHRWDISLVNLSGEQLKAVVLASYAVLFAGLLYGCRPVKRDAAEPDQNEPAETSCSVAQDCVTAHRRFLALAQTALVLCCMLLMSPMSSKQHFCALFPGIVVCVFAYLFAGRSRLILLCLATVFLAGTTGARDIVGAELRTQMQAYGSVTVCTLAVYAGLLLVMIRLRSGSMTARESSSIADRVGAPGTTAAARQLSHAA